MTRGALAGIRIVELGGIGPAPFGAMLLADHGADVVRLDPPASLGLANPTVLLRNRRSVAVDLKKPEGAEAALHLIESADAAWRNGSASASAPTNVWPATRDCSTPA